LIAFDRAKREEFDANSPEAFQELRGESLALNNALGSVSAQNLSEFVVIAGHQLGVREKDVAYFRKESGKLDGVAYTPAFRFGTSR
jgi:hypothetical protein